MIHSYRIVLALLLGLFLSACAHHANVTYPNTPGGTALRQLYTARTDAERGAANRAIDNIRDPADRDALKPVMLSIISQDDSVNAITIAWQLIQWDHQIGATAPEFRHLIPALAAGLRRDNDPNDTTPTRITVASASMLLLSMNRDAAYPLRQTLYDRFTGPWKHNEGESPDAWTLSALSRMISTFGEEAVPVLTRTLNSPERIVRTCALEAFTFTKPPSGFDGWIVPDSQMAANTPAARAAAPKVAERLWDADSSVCMMAIRAVATLYTPSTLPSRIRDRLNELANDPINSSEAKTALKKLAP